jgi:hypothetical protein
MAQIHPDRRLGYKVFLKYPHSRERIFLIIHFLYGKKTIEANMELRYQDNILFFIKFNDEQRVFPAGYSNHWIIGELIAGMFKKNKIEVYKSELRKLKRMVDKLILNASSLIV